MLTGMTKLDWSIVLVVFDAAQSRRGKPGHDNRKFLEGVHYFTVHNITWRGLPSAVGNWNSVKSLATATPISRAIATPRRLGRAPRDGLGGCWEAVGKWPAGATVRSQAQAGHLPIVDSEGVG
jgi:hypothetical protein